MSKVKFTYWESSVKEHIQKDDKRWEEEKKVRGIVDTTKKKSPKSNKKKK